MPGLPGGHAADSKGYPRKVPVGVFGVGFKMDFVFQNILISGFPLLSRVSVRYCTWS